jgi:hypothetical protein
MIRDFREMGYEIPPTDLPQLTVTLRLVLKSLAQHTTIAPSPSARPFSRHLKRNDFGHFGVVFAP